jgi:hypothetical protein
MAATSLSRKRVRVKNAAALAAAGAVVMEGVGAVEIAAIAVEIVSADRARRVIEFQFFIGAEHLRSASFVSMSLE